jgi:hypothetical protein
VKFNVVEANVQRLEATKATEADKRKIHPKIFQLPQAWMFPRIGTGNSCICVLEEKPGNARE